MSFCSIVVLVIMLFLLHIITTLPVTPPALFRLSRCTFPCTVCEWRLLYLRKTRCINSEVSQVEWESSDLNALRIFVALQMVLRLLCTLWLQMPCLTVHKNSQCLRLSFTIISWNFLVHFTSISKRTSRLVDIIILYLLFIIYLFMRSLHAVNQLCFYIYALHLFVNYEPVDCFPSLFTRQPVCFAVCKYLFFSIWNLPLPFFVKSQVPEHESNVYIGLNTIKYHPS